jgi:hypothetical protein
MATRIWSGDDATTPNDWSVTGNWEGGVVPVSTDDVYIPAGSASITAGLNQSAVTLTSLTIEQGFDQNIGSSDGYLQVGTSALSVDCDGGEQYIDVGASTPSPVIENTGSSSSGTRAFNILGSAIGTLSVNGGSVGVAIAGDETSTVTTIRLLDGDLYVGEGTTLTTLYVSGGAALQGCSSTTTEIHGGSIETIRSGTISTLNVYGGSATPNSSGTITTLNLYGGQCDFTQSGVARTVTTTNVLAYDPADLLTDPEFATLSTITGPTTTPYRLSYLRS